MTERHKAMCGCEICIIARLLHQGLLAWRKRRIKELEVIDKDRAAKYTSEIEDTDGVPLYPTHIEELQCVQCPKVAGMQHPHWRCVLGRCDKCPQYVIPGEEQAVGLGAPTIMFRVYLEVTSCTAHGPAEVRGKTECLLCKKEASENPNAWAERKKKPHLSTRKHSNLLKRSIGEFHKDYHIPFLKKLAYHLPYVRMLGRKHCGNERARAAATLNQLLIRRDYADRWKAVFHEEIQSEHFGNSRSLSIEGVSVESWAEKTLELYREGVKDGLPEEELSQILAEGADLAFHCHLADSSKQDAASTHEHMTALIQLLLGKKILVKFATLWEDTDGCAKQAPSPPARPMSDHLNHTPTHCLTLTYVAVPLCQGPVAHVRAQLCLWCLH